MKIKMTKQTASNAIVTGLSVYALANSYMHGVEFASSHHAGGWAWGTAAIPEALLVSALLQDKRDARYWVKVSAAVAWTFGVNAASALSHGFDIGTLIVGLMAPAAAVLTAWAGGHGKPAKTTKTASKKIGVVEGGITWAKRQKVVRTADEIQAARGCSAASARKIYEGAYGKKAA